jgi:hypothetical protein
MASKRELIDTGRDKRFVRRDQRVNSKNRMTLAARYLKT